MAKQKRLSSLGEMNYRNVGLGFAIGVLMEMRKEIEENCRQYRDILVAEKALTTVLNGLPDSMTENQVELSSAVFLTMEQQIVKHEFSTYKGFMTDLEKEAIYEMLYPINNDGTEY